MRPHGPLTITLTITQVDAFTDVPFAGNPAAVCITDGPLDPALMQNVALELNLSETAFLHPEGDGYRLRWFTPLVEVDLCGHATLAAAHVLWEQGLLAPDEQARFFTNSGELGARRSEGWIYLDFPATPVEPLEPPEAPAGLDEILGAAPTFVGRSTFDLLVELGSEQLVRELAPDLTRLGQLDARGVIVTAPADAGGEAADAGEVDFVSRFFAPTCGVPEDPVTGSAHCALGPYWQGRLGKARFRCRQVSRRSGMLEVIVVGERVSIGGQAVTTLRGELTVQ